MTIVPGPETFFFVGSVAVAVAVAVVAVIAVP